MRRLEIFFFKYFSTSTIDNDDDNWLRYLVALILFTPALLGIVLDTTGRPISALLCFILFMALMVIFGVVWIIVFFYHNWRIRYERQDNNLDT